MRPIRIEIFSNAGEDQPNTYHHHSTHDRVRIGDAGEAARVAVWQVKRHVVDAYFRKYAGVLRPDAHVHVATAPMAADACTSEQNGSSSSSSAHDLVRFDAAVDALDDDATVAAVDACITLRVFLDLQSDEAAFRRYPNGDKFSLACTSIDRLTRSILGEFSAEERAQRVQLAACYRLVEQFGWTDTIYGHLTARSESGKESFLINPFGLLYDEITASSLVRIDLEGNTQHGGIVPWMGINRAGYVIHSAVHEARKDINCVMHVHFADGAAVSCLEEGVAALSQTSHILGPVAYHEYEGIAVSRDERARLQADLGTEAKVLILRNHGIVTLGESIGEAFLRMFILVEACKIQVKAQSSALKTAGAVPRPFASTLHVPRPETIDLTRNIAFGFTKEGFGKKELAAFMRRLDAQDASYRL